MSKPAAAIPAGPAIIVPPAQSPANAQVGEVPDAARASQQFILLVLLLLFYCVGPFMVLVMAILALYESPAHVIEDETLLKFLSEVAKNPAAYLNVIQQMILPVAAAVTAANHRSLQWGPLVSAIFVIPLATLFVCILDAGIFSVYGPAEGSPLIAQLFFNAAQNLAVYVMLFVGLKLAERG